MSVFSPTWLDLREAVDAASRSKPPAALLAASRGGSEALRIVDLGCGTGANLRYLAPRLGVDQDWTLIDSDARLIDAIPARLAPWAHALGGRFAPDGAGAMLIRAPGLDCRVRTRLRDLAGGLDERDTGDVQLVTASALLDLVSRRWLEALAGYCRRLRAGVLFALTYDGRMGFDPAASGDERMRELINRHQLTDKGFGPALGPAATSTALELFGGLGYVTQAEPSDWHLGSHECPLQTALIEGWLGAAVEVAPGEAAQLQAWSRCRRAQIERYELRMAVGHTDIAGWLP
ncbi:MAG: class I SAM-dependent methyltransferase [Gammaproteobacteria bacterium]|jgi:SAM-dependent methyltransferase